jgi:hypothetical protein
MVRERPGTAAKSADLPSFLKNWSFFAKACDPAML